MLPVCFKKPLQKVLDDPTSQTKFPTAVNARRGAIHILQWCSNSDNSVVLQKFAEELTRDLRAALVTPTGKGLWRDKLWESYYCIRTTGIFTNRWTVFLCNANSPAGTPVLYQHFIDLMFKALLQWNYSVATDNPKQPSPMTNNEANALRYVAGWERKLKHPDPVIHSMIWYYAWWAWLKIHRISSGPCEEWTYLIEHGGLWHVWEDTYQDVHNELLKRVVELFITIRGSPMLVHG